MKPIDFLLLALLAAGVLLALRAALRHPGCGGDCARCARAKKNCNRNGGTR